MKSANDYLDARQNGMSHHEAMSTLPSCIPHYINRVPLEIYNAVLINGWKVFPLFNKEEARHPHELLHLATNDIETVTNWARMKPTWAVATGPQTGLVMLEASGEKGLDSLLSLCEDNWDWLDTIRIQNVSRRQLFFRWREGFVQNVQFGPINDHLRLYGTGECVVLPSEHKDPLRDLHYFLAPCNSLLLAPRWLRNIAFTSGDAVSASRFSSANRLRAA